MPETEGVLRVDFQPYVDEHFERKEQEIKDAIAQVENAGDPFERIQYLVSASRLEYRLVYPEDDFIELVRGIAKKTMQDFARLVKAGEISLLAVETKLKKIEDQELRLDFGISKIGVVEVFLRKIDSVLSSNPAPEDEVEWESRLQLEEDDFHKYQRDDVTQPRRFFHHIRARLGDYPLTEQPRFKTDYLRYRKVMLDADGEINPSGIKELEEIKSALVARLTPIREGIERHRRHLKALNDPTFLIQGQRPHEGRIKHWIRCEELELKELQGTETALSNRFLCIRGLLKMWRIEGAIPPPWPGDSTGEIIDSPSHFNPLDHFTSIPAYEVFKIALQLISQRNTIPGKKAEETKTAILEEIARLHGSSRKNIEGHANKNDWNGDDLRNAILHKAKQLPLAERERIQAFKA